MGLSVSCNPSVATNPQAVIFEVCLISLNISLFSPSVSSVGARQRSAALRALLQSFTATLQTRQRFGLCSYPTGSPKDSGFHHVASNPWRYVL